MDRNEMRDAVDKIIMEHIHGKSYKEIAKAFPDIDNLACPGEHPWSRHGFFTALKDGTNIEIGLYYEGKDWMKQGIDSPYTIQAFAKDDVIYCESVAKDCPLAQKQYQMDSKKLFEMLPKKYQDIFRDYLMEQDLQDYQKLYDEKLLGVRQAVSGEHKEVSKEAIKKFFDNGSDGYAYIHFDGKTPADKIFNVSAFKHGASEATAKLMYGSQFTFDDINWDFLLDNPKALAGVAFHTYADYGCIFLNFEKKDDKCLIYLDCPYENDEWYVHVLEDFANGKFRFHDVIEAVKSMQEKHPVDYENIEKVFTDEKERVYEGRYFSDMFGKVEVTLMMPSGYLELSGERMPEEMEGEYDEPDTECILGCDDEHTDFYIDDPDVWQYMDDECRLWVNNMAEEYFETLFWNEKDSMKLEDEDYEK